MKKDKNLIKFTSFVLLVVVIALILVAGTFAKYTSEATGTATAIVAKWQILAGDGTEEGMVDISGSDQTIAFNLFDTIEEENGGEELDVLMDEETGKVIRIAPGTSGAFDLYIQNNSEVTAAYTIGFVVEDTSVDYDIPLQFNVNNKGWTNSLEDVQETIIAIGDSSVANVQWKWAFEGGVDYTDTMLGIEAPSITVTATLNVVQYDASEAPVVETPVEDFDAYARLPLTSGYAHLTEWVGNSKYMSATETVYLEAGTTITGNLGGIETMIFARESKEDDSVVNMEDIDPDNGIIIISEMDSATIENTGWYDFTFANKNGSDLQDEQLQELLGYYVSFSK